MDGKLSKGNSAFPEDKCDRASLIQFTWKSVSKDEKFSCSGLVLVSAVLHENRVSSRKETKLRL